jgi:hypothetical protein
MTQIPAVERHPWNTEFTWIDRTGPFRRITVEQASKGPAVGRVPANDPRRQFPVLVDGEPVAVEPLG